MKRVLDSKEEPVNRENIYYWMNKYISLLEKYNELLLQQSKDEDFEPKELATNRTLSSTVRKSKQN